ncbi:IS66 family insertion sequence element accessory protein TnpB [Mesorhizobium sp. M0814]|uniref:IS66 family insertion sequence element accessory protein TnpB n=1 Tax=Mesorhizobium sp. M0814 TaxID=2957004 RepID=UPI003334B34B
MAWALVRDAGSDPFNGELYVFRAKRADRIKIVWWDGCGVCLGVRLAEAVPQDAIAIPLGPHTRHVVAGAPSYFADRLRPIEPADLMDMNASALTMQAALSTAGSLNATYAGRVSSGYPRSSNA